MMSRMDRIDAMKVFVATLDEGSLAGAGRLLRRSPAAVSRAIAFLEAHVGVELLHRTTRSIRLERGRRTLCRCVPPDTDRARGSGNAGASVKNRRRAELLTISAPPISGEDILRPIVDEFLDAYPMVSARLLLLDRAVNLVEEGVDVALRVAQLPDLSLIATKVGGDVRRVVVAAPDYLAGRAADRRASRPGGPGHHRIHQLRAGQLELRAGGGLDHSADGSVRAPTDVNSEGRATASAIRGRGLTRLYSYQSPKRSGRRLKVVLARPNIPRCPSTLNPKGSRVGAKGPRLPRLRRATAAVDLLEACERRPCAQLVRLCGALNRIGGTKLMAAFRPIADSRKEPKPEPIRCLELGPV